MGNECKVCRKRNPEEELILNAPFKKIQNQQLSKIQNPNMRNIIHLKKYKSRELQKTSFNKKFFIIFPKSVKYIKIC